MVNSVVGAVWSICLNGQIYFVALLFLKAEFYQERSRGFEFDSPNLEWE
ncbi:hypothetical protein C4J92_1552 [Pseudomonas sp. R3-18-08]|nr:hypothetical protein C4J92_1552 [Pseudomonas sp. R3-18-08]